MRKKILRIMAEFLVLLMIIVAFILINEQFDDKRKSSFKPITDSSKYAYKIEELRIDGEELVIKGWFFERREIEDTESNSTQNKEFGIVLFDLNKELNFKPDGLYDNNIGLKMNMRYYSRPDIDNYFKCDYCYPQCGFIATLDKSNIDLDNGEYQIVFKPEEEGSTGIFFDGNAYINKGKVSYVNPKDMMELYVQGTDLENIVDNGICIASSQEADICVYQKNRNLYWIAGPNYEFDMQRKTHIQLRFDVIQNLEMENGSIINILGNSIGDDFENYEATASMDCGEYRVSIRTIPDEYPIIRGSTGCLEGNNIWSRSFRLDIVS